jgi:hypothetical protein
MRGARIMRAIWRRRSAPRRPVARAEGRELYSNEVGQYVIQRLSGIDEESRRFAAPVLQGSETRRARPRWRNSGEFKASHHSSQKPPSTSPLLSGEREGRAGHRSYPYGDDVMAEPQPEALSRLEADPAA